MLATGASVGWCLTPLGGLGMKALPAVGGRGSSMCSDYLFVLRLDHPDWVAMQTRQAGLEGTGEIKLRELVKQALRMRPSRIVVGEVRAEECLDLLLALNSGLPGLATVHANSAREALVKLCTLPLLAGENISAGFVIPTVASCVDLVVHLAIDPAGHRRVREIVSVPGRVEHGTIETEALFTTPGTHLERAHGMPNRLDRFAQAGIEIHRLLTMPEEDG
jgi:pilus assembly protein CpaF